MNYRLVLHWSGQKITRARDSCWQIGSREHICSRLARAHSKCFTRTIKHAGWLAGRARHNRIGGSQDSKVSLLLRAASATHVCVYAALCVYCQFASPANSILVRAWRFAAAPRIEPRVIAPRAHWLPMMSSQRRHWPTGGGNLSPSLSFLVRSFARRSFAKFARGCYVHYIVRSLCDGAAGPAVRVCANAHYAARSFSVRWQTSSAPSRRQ